MSTTGACIRTRTVLGGHASSHATLYVTPRCRCLPGQQPCDCCTNWSCGEQQLCLRSVLATPLTLQGPAQQICNTSTSKGNNLYILTALRCSTGECLATWEPVTGVSVEFSFLPRALLRVRIQLMSTTGACFHARTALGGRASSHATLYVAPHCRCLPIRTVA